MIVDAHVHLDLKRHKSVKKAAIQVVEDMDSAGIDKAILLPDNVQNRNEHIKEACELFPDRFYGYGMVDPKQNKYKIQKDIDRLAANPWFKGIKIHPRTQGFTLREPGVFHIAHHIGHYGLPLTIDCLPTFFKYVALDEGIFPDAFDKLAKANPITNIVVLHMGGHRLMDALSVALSNKNIFLEVAYTFYYYANSSVEMDMAFAIKKIGSERIIYGTDHPDVGIKKGLKQFSKFCDKNGMTPKQKKDIFGNTILNLIHASGKAFKLSETDRKGIVTLYENRLKKHGISLRTMGWRDKKQQNTRFKKLASIGRLQDKKILDVGCGFGDFYSYLTEKGVRTEYTGYDLSPEVIKAARKKQPRLKFEVKDILQKNIKSKFDYVFASGVLNKRVSNNPAYAMEMIAAMFKLCRLGIAINLFTTRVDFIEEDFYYYPISEVLKFAKELSHSVAIKRNYPLSDFTLYIHKDK